MDLSCPNGHANNDDASFCSTCGTPLPKGAAARGSGNAVGSAATPSGTAGTAGGPPNAPDAAATGAYDRTGPVVPLPPESATPPRHGPQRRTLAWLIGGAVLLLAVFGGVYVATSGGSDNPATSGKTLRGIAVLFDTDGVDGSWDSCEGTGGYDDFSSGMRLTIKGSKDQIVGTGDVVNVTEDNLDEVARAELDGDHPIGLDSNTLTGVEKELRSMLHDSEDTACMLYFVAKIEPSDYYSVELADRGALTYSRSQLKQKGYVVSVSLGNP